MMSDDCFQRALQAAGIGAWDWNPTTNNIWYSAEAKTILGLPEDSTTSCDKIREAILPADRDATQRALKRALDPNLREKLRLRFRVRRPNGDIRWVLVRGEVTFSAVPGVSSATRCVGTLQDITEFSQVETERQLGETRLKLAIAAAKIAVWEYDVAKALLIPSPELNELLGLPADAKPSLDDLRSGYLAGEHERLSDAAKAALESGNLSFRVEYRYRRPSGETCWLGVRAEIFLDADGKPERIIGVVRDITSRRQSAEQQSLLIRELHHRVRNTLAVVQGIAAATAKASDSLADFRDAFANRISSLARTHALITDSTGQLLSVRELINLELAPYDATTNRVSVEGPDIRLASEQAVPVGMAIHELTTNAVKYGALSNPAGRISIRIISTDEQIELRWDEESGFESTPGARSGFGTTLLMRIVGTQLSTQPEREFRNGGMSYRLSFAKKPEAVL